MKSQGTNRSRLSIRTLLRPHAKALTIALIAVIGEGVANLLDPWPLKIVLDNVLRSKHRHGWLNHLIYSMVGHNKMAILELAAGAVLAIAVLGAICSYIEKNLITSVSQWVMHDLRRTLYFHIQRLSLAYHDQKQTGDLISRVTGDIGAIQSFIASGLLSVFANGLTLLGMIAVMFYISWRFTLIALSVAPVLFAVVYTYTRRIKKASREVRKKQGEIVSVMEEVLSSIRLRSRRFKRNSTIWLAPGSRWMRCNPRGAWITNAWPVISYHAAVRFHGSMGGDSGIEVLLRVEPSLGAHPAK